MIGGDSMDKDKELELLMDIQEKVGRIDERLKKVEDTDRKAEEAIRLGEKNEEKIVELSAAVEELKESRKWTQRTAIGAFITAATAVLSWIHPPF
ncbi:hemolysin XhlA family protein [Limosilactobacillus reuteri]|uniref:hemolysin XhlA family protein n=1 Tax=Limosilactobacillus reuteri TaxID=1598 RepID=UPI001C5BE76F|nr:hemolysin XhlA family protein [Limosilactobacillus reuteri]MBW3350609.1 hemolysin XhlA family protein [Limosilactobacillus reuteri]UUW69653.1 hemolysin XhlA family protein [Limosilactobacillus reuteri]